MIRRYVSKYKNVIIIIVFSVIFGFLRNILLGRMLSIYDFGIYSLSLSIIGLIYPLLLFGQQRGLIRFLIHNRLEDYSWKKPFDIFRRLSIILTLIIVPCLTWYYHMDFYITFFCIASILSSVYSELCSIILRSKGKFEVAIFFQRFIRVILSILAIIFYLFDISSIYILLLIFTLIHLVYGIISYYYIKTFIKVGKKKVPNYLIKDGLYFSLMDFSGLIYFYGVNMLIVGLISLEALGAFFAINIIIRIFELFTQSADFIIMPISSKLDYSTSLFIIIFNVIISIFLFILLHNYGASLLSFLYDEKYDMFLFLLPYAIIIGFIKMMEVVPSNIIGGIYENNMLKKYLLINIITPLILFPLSIYLIKIAGLVGAMNSLIIFYLIKVISGYYMFFKEKNTFLKSL